MYLQMPLDERDSQRSTGSHAFKAGVVLIGGCCLVFLGIVAISSTSSSVDESSNLFGLAASSRLTRKPSSMPPQMIANQLPGASPWKELALAGLEASSRCGRDVSMNGANPVKTVLASMDSKSRDVVAAAEQAAVSKMEDLQAGQTGPMGFFDPLGLSTNLPEGKILFYREAELKHGRVCMLASLGFLVGENFHPLFGGTIDVPSYVAFQATPLQTFWVAVAAAVALPEVLYSIPTFAKPSDEGAYKDQDTWTIRADGRVPGDLGYDPLGLKPQDPEEFLKMQNKELNNGRLAMIGIAGMIAQELVSGEKISATFDSLAR